MFYYDGEDRLPCFTKFRVIVAKHLFHLVMYLKNRFVKWVDSLMHFQNRRVREFLFLARARLQQENLASPNCLHLKKLLILGGGKTIITKGHKHRCHHSFYCSIAEHMLCAQQVAEAS